MSLIRRKPRERDLEWCLRQGVHARGGLCLKFKSSVRGVPDRIVVTAKGKVLFVEMKSEYGRLSRLQELCIEDLRQRGCPVFVLRNVDGVVEFFDLVDSLG